MNQIENYILLYYRIIVFVQICVEYCRNMIDRFTEIHLAIGILSLPLH